MSDRIESVNSVGPTMSKQEIVMSKRSASRVFLIAVILAVLALLTAPTKAGAQDVASITGVITDQSGAVIAGADVTLVNPQTGTKYKTTTNEVGLYRINEVKPGPGYEIQFAHEGFREVKVSNLYLNVDTTRTQNAQMILGATQETVEVSAATQAVTLNTTDVSVGNNFQVEVLNDMPVQDRS